MVHIVAILGDETKRTLLPHGEKAEGHKVNIHNGRAGMAARGYDCKHFPEMLHQTFENPSDDSVNANVLSGEKIAECTAQMWP